MGLFTPRRTLLSAGAFNGFTDWHSHILPGVDDGIRTMEDSLAVLAYFEQIGVQQVWCTPHIMEDMPNTPEALKQRFEELGQAYSGPIALHLAAEHMLDPLFEERLASGQVMPVGPAGRQLLVETSYFNPPVRMDSMLREIRSKGFSPVLAHPERYNYMDTKDYERLHEDGIIFQLNIVALSGGYGSHVQKKAQWMLDHGMYTYSGTDIHSLGQFKERINLKAKFTL